MEFEHFSPDNFCSGNVRLIKGGLHRLCICMYVWPRISLGRWSTVRKMKPEESSHIRVTFLGIHVVSNRKIVFNRRCAMEISEN